jgi:hypothetical protein
VNGERPRNDDELWLVEAAIALLAGGRWIACFSLVFAGTAAFALVATDLREVPLRVAVSTVLALGAVAAYLALRNAMDHVFFVALRPSLPAASPTLASLDSALRTLRWFPEKKAGRGLAARVAGVQQLVRAQGVVLLMQVVLVACVPWMR